MTEGENPPQSDPPASGDDAFPLNTVIVGSTGPGAPGSGRRRASPSHVWERLTHLLTERGLVRALSFLLRRLHKPLVLLGALILYRVVSSSSLLQGLDDTGRKTLAVFGVAVLLWMTGVLPMMVTSLLVLLLLPSLDILTPRETFALFTNDASIFILGVFILSGALIETGITRRIALLLMRRFGQSPLSLLFVVFITNSALSFFISEHAVAAMMFPILLELAHAIQMVSPSASYTRALVLCAAWGTTTGGILTLLGGGRAPLALGILRETTGQSIGFFEWIKFSLPVTVAMIAAAFLTLRIFLKSDLQSMAGARQYLEHRAKELGHVRLREVICLGILVLCIALWAILGEKHGMASIALLGAVLVFVFGVSHWRDVEANVNWGIFVMYGGAICLAQALNKTGVAGWVSQNVVVGFGQSPAAVLVLVILMALVLTEFMSNAAVVAVLLPVALPLAAPLGLDPKILTLATALPAGLNFIFPIATPANAIAFSSGFLRIRDVFLPGLLLDLTAFSVLVVTALYIWPHLS
ncbi:MAG: SLC13/DASS family transporter [Nitrospirae bacterium]|nr:SLC13/DASS family transporter [Nitrospirota bacterium]